MRNSTLVYTYPQRYFFVAKDIEALRREYTVLEHTFNSGSPLLLPSDFLRQFIFLLIALSKGSRIALVHFAGYHSLLPVLMGFRTYIIVAGSDSCSYPSINYGSFRKKWMSRAMAFSMQRATAILPVHASLERFENTYSDAGPRSQGYAHHVKQRIAPTIPIPYGFDVEKWKMPDAFRSNDQILCLATGAAMGNAIHFRKGIDLLITAAQELPDLQFTVVGAEVRSYIGVPANMRFLPVIPAERLVQVFSENGIYVQASIMEGFPNALCEAMLMGCIPIVSNITSMPDIVNGVGRILLHRDAQALVALIREIRSLSAEEIDRLRKAARQRVIGFTMEARIDRLMEVIRSTDH